MLSKNINASTLSPEQVWDIMNSGQIDELSVRNLFRKYRNQLLVVFAFAFGAALTFTLTSATESQGIMPSDPVAMAASIIPTKPAKPEFSKENLMAEIVHLGILFPSVVMAQAELESAYLTAGSSAKINNLFGMRYPGQRTTTAIGIYLQGKDTIIYGTRSELRQYLSRPTYAVYAHWSDAVLDYKLWQDYSFRKKEKYIDFLARVYATGPEYGNRLNEMTSK
jgi:hypothetical protein